MGCDAIAKMGYGIAFSYEDSYSMSRALDILKGIHYGKEESEEGVDLKPIKEALDALPIEMFRHGYDSGMMPALIIKGTLRRADWGDPERIDIPPVDPEWDSIIEQCKQILGLTTKTPGWILTATYW